MCNSEGDRNGSSESQPPSAGEADLTSGAFLRPPPLIALQGVAPCLRFSKAPKKACKSLIPL